MSAPSRAAFNVKAVLTLIILLSWLGAIGFGLWSNKLDYPTALATFAGPAGVVLGYWFATDKEPTP